MIANVLVAMLSAQPAGVDNATESAYRFERALWLYNNDRTHEALDQFLASYRLSPSAEVKKNIAKCFEDLEEPRRAFSAWTEYLRHTEISDEDRTAARAALDKIFNRVAVLHVRSRPEGATIFVDRTDLGSHGTTPRLFATKPGTHRLILRRDQHKEATVDVLARSSTVVHVDVALEPILEVLRVTSTPTAADVRIDGERAGATPLVTRVRLGSRHVTVTMPGHLTAKDVVQVREGAEASFHAALEKKPEPVGDVAIIMEPQRAELIIDDRLRGISATTLTLPVGRHSILVRKIGYRPLRTELDVVEGQQLVQVKLHPRVQQTGRGPWPWVLLATSAAAGVVGAAIGVAALGSGRDFDDSVTGGTETQLSRTRTLNTVADVLYSAAGLGAVATTAAFVFGEPRQVQSSTISVSRIDFVTR